MSHLVPDIVITQYILNSEAFYFEIIIATLQILISQIRSFGKSD